MTSRAAVTLLSVTLGAVLAPAPVHSVGEADGQGFPSYQERLLLQLANRARVDPDTALAGCPPTSCLEHTQPGDCYTPKNPLRYRNTLNRAARFHSDFLVEQQRFQHTSSCTLVGNVASLYPASCGGEASCSCVGGTETCSPVCTSAGARVALFGSSWSGEIIAADESAASAFDGWLFETALNDTCGFQDPDPNPPFHTNGHRWLLLQSGGSVGFGHRAQGCLFSSNCYTGDFGSGLEDSHPLASGIHIPQAGSSVTAMASWQAAAGPSLAEIVVGAACTGMTLERGTPGNGSWTAQLSGLPAAGCTRYYFRFADAQGSVVTYPQTGSLGIGPVGSCPTWTSERPADVCGSGLIFEDGFESGDVSAW